MEEQIRFMKMAIRLAEKGAGWVNPNPLVGAVIVKDGKVIGQGYHEYFGGPHAEVNAIRNAKEDVRGAHLYITLEPCCHKGKTPPCAPFVAESGITEVTVGMVDPNPLVQGKGIACLKEKGIRVNSGIFEKEIRKQNEAFIKYITTGFPFCTLKIAMSLDGKTATSSGESKWISCIKSRDKVHDMRRHCSAIMVGINTVLNDDPILSCRMKTGKVKDPVKVIVDSRGKIPLTAMVLQHEPQRMILATTALAKKQKLQEIERLGAQVIVCPEKDVRVDLKYLFKALGVMGIDSILLEGGSTLAFSAIREGLVDKAVVFIAPRILGGKNSYTPVGGDGFEPLSNAMGVHDWKVSGSGDDIMIEGYLNKQEDLKEKES
ncbi:MAG: bifunctional diaminohydroxyphosphoribosylaminopyrimidine deaminase/5-amino-6-(5-phosphoribosylamino)uracil reductase RibD [Bacteroidota bacterium]|nr:bifunctional diaminohydroxyphosphoribosylaminopyrimidine deaminase/5-amino-6-(5-phosphoribosylamino)uracil reductase RibD [Bacteroidota bacterium]